MIGIDCGSQGAVCVAGNSLNWFPMPLYTNHQNLPHISPVDVLTLIYKLTPYTSLPVAIEVPRSIPNLNKSSNIFRQGASVQACVQACVSAGFPLDSIYLISEREWQPAMDRGHKNIKDDYIDQLPNHIIQEFTPPSCRIPHRGAVDAYLMCLYLERRKNSLRSFKQLLETPSKKTKTPSHLTKNSKLK